MGLFVDVIGQFEYSSEKRLAQAKAAMLAVDVDQFVTEADFIWGDKEVSIEMKKGTTLSHILEGCTALEALSKKAAAGVIDCHLDDNYHSLIRILPKGKQRTMRNDWPVREGEQPIFARFRHPVSISSFAISQDERFVALGGGVTALGGRNRAEQKAADITVWDVVQEKQIDRLVGCSRVVKDIRFTTDQLALAAINDRGGLSVWAWPERDLIRKEKQGGMGRWELYEDEQGIIQRREEESSGALMLNGRFSLQFSTRKCAILDKELGRVVATLPFKDLMIPERLRYGRWLADGRSCLLFGQKSICIWHPSFLQERPTKREEVQLCATAEELPEYLIQWDFLPKEGLLIGTDGRASSLFTAPVDLTVPREEVLTPWDKFKLARQQADDKYKGVLKREWKWDEEKWGYRGVHTFGDQLVWFQNSYNPHGTSGANNQSYADFLENGTNEPIAKEILEELYDAVVQLGEKDEREG